MSVQQEASRVVDHLCARLGELRERATGLKSFVPHHSDVTITTFSKSGTTLLQNLVYQLVVAAGCAPGDSNGDDFFDISQVVPWIECAPVTGVSESKARTVPRIWKTHATAAEFDLSPNGGRYIYCVRNGQNLPASFLDFVLDWVTTCPIKGNELRTACFHEYVNSRFLGLHRNPDGSYTRPEKSLGHWFSHVNGWTSVKRENVLVLVYEEIIKDLTKTARRIADFLNLEVPTEGIDGAVARCDREAMASDSRFRDILISDAMGWKNGGGVKARPEGAPGFRSVKFTDESLAVYKDMFLDAFGVATYEELVNRIRTPEP